MLKVLEYCVYSLYWASRYKVFLKKSVQIQPYIKVWPLSVWDLKSQLFFLPGEKDWFRVSLSYLLWNWVFKSQLMPQNEIIFEIFFFCPEMFLDKLHIWRKNLFCDLDLVYFLVVICSSLNPLCHRLEHIPDETFLLLRQHLEIFSMQF